MTPQDDFMRRVRVDSTTGCWIWRRSTRGYGKLKQPDGRLELAHRAAYKMFVGAIPDGRHLHHICEVRRCCNPEHLKPVTPLEHAAEHHRGQRPAEYADALQIVRQAWTADAIVAAIRAFNARYGSPPSAMDWNPSMARATNRDDVADRFYTDGCWPNANTIMQKFGRWNAAIEAAGLTPRPRGIKRADMAKRAA